MGSAAVQRTRPYRLGTRASSDVLTTPDLTVKIGSKVLLVDAKYKGRAWRPLNRIGAADLYEAFAFARAAKLDEVVLMYPRPASLPRTPLGSLSAFDEVLVESCRIVGVDVECRGISLSRRLPDLRGVSCKRPHSNRVNNGGWKHSRHRTPATACQLGRPPLPLDESLAQHVDQDQAARQSPGSARRSSRWSAGTRGRVARRRSTCGPCRQPARASRSWCRSMSRVPSVSMRAVSWWPLYVVSMSSGGTIVPDEIRSLRVTWRHGVLSHQGPCRPRPWRRSRPQPPAPSGAFGPAGRVGANLNVG